VIVDGETWVARSSLRKLFIVLVIAAAIVAGAGGCARRGAADTKIVVIGIDGLDLKLADPLLDQGRLPNLAGLLERGSRLELRSLELPWEMRSTSVWKVMATGKAPIGVGVEGFADADGAALDPGTSDWRSRPIWGILGGHGYTVGVVNHLAIWPALPVNGYLVTYLAKRSPEDGHSDIGRTTFPDELAAELRPHLKPFARTTVDDVARFMSGETWADGENPYIRDEVEFLKGMYAADESVLSMTSYLLESREQPDYLFVYFDALDFITRQYWEQMYPHPKSRQASEEFREAVRNVVPRYYERIDGIVGDILERIDDGSTVFVCSGYGCRGPVRTKGVFKRGTWMRRHAGALVAAGPGIRRGGTAADASIFDFAPTILALCGRPVPRDMAGFVLTEILDAEYLEAHPLAYVDTYERAEE
jgi:predicted AlkP superfamily phosphohydrolase/phosphomutase